MLFANGPDLMAFWGCDRMAEGTELLTRRRKTVVGSNPTAPTVVESSG